MFLFPAHSLTVSLLTVVFHKDHVSVLYIIYSSKLFQIIERHLPDSHCYANDSQLYLSFRPDELSSQQEAINSMEDCIKDIRLWTEHDKLLLNDEKTEFLIIGTRQQLSKVNFSSIAVGNSDVVKSLVVRNLGVFTDDRLSMNSHINKICNSSFYYFHNIERIRKHLSRNSTETLIHAFVSSRLDLYCNSFLDPYFREFTAAINFSCSKYLLRIGENDVTFSKIPHMLKL